MNVLRKINKMRLDRDWSVYRLSLESGVSQSTLTNMFNRETLPSITTLECICNAFGITMSDFFADETAISSNATENEFLILYNKMDEATKKSLLMIMRRLAGE